MGEPAIVVRGLHKSFGAKDAVAGINLEIAAGSLAGLVSTSCTAGSRLASLALTSSASVPGSISSVLSTRARANSMA